MDDKTKQFIDKKPSCR